MKNLEIVRILNAIADILELQEVPFKPQAYRRAVRGVEALAEDIEEVYQRGELKKIPGVGESIAQKIEEIIRTGKLDYYEKLKKRVKVDIERLGQIPGLGPKKIKVLYQKLGVKSIDDLEKAIQQKKLQKLQGFGEETEKNLGRGIQFLRTRPSRFLYAQVQPYVQLILEKFRRFPFVQKMEIAGSFRRGKETIGDLDFLAVSSQPEKVMGAFTAFPDVKEILAKGTTKSSVRLGNGLQMDLRVVKEKEFGSALLYSIGSKEHNVEVRKLALAKGYTLSEYGLFRLKNKARVAGRTEEEVYQKLGLAYIPPELRENSGEIKAALKNQLPKLVAEKDVQGLFHNHSTWTDGSNSLLEMAQAAAELKLKFISFNDHYGPIGITRPLNEKRLGKYLQEIKKVQRKVGVRLFNGIEIDILKDGTLPLSKNKLKELDVVIAAVHLATKMSEAEMTKRVCSALENYPINILAHPTDRLINEREPLAINLEKVFETAKQNQVFLEINSLPHRMDLNGPQIRAALEAGCQLALGTDAHDAHHLPVYTLGLLSARRGWAEKKDLLNCWDLNKIEKALEK